MMGSGGRSPGLMFSRAETRIVSGVSTPIVGGQALSGTPPTLTHLSRLYRELGAGSPDRALA